jgi:WD40 repeat protein
LTTDMRTLLLTTLFAVAGSAAVPIPNVVPLHPVSPQINSLAWRPDGQLIALGEFKEVRLVDPATRKTVATLAGHAEQVRSVAFSPDGKLLAAAGGLPARSGEVKIWDVDARKELVSIKGHGDCIYSVAFSPDGKTIATASYDKLIYLWNVADGAQIRKLKDHIDSVYAIAFTPDGKHLASASADRGVKIWDTATGERLYTLSDALDGLNALAISPDGKTVAAGGYDKTIRIWSLGDKGAKLEHSAIAHEDAILQLAFSPDGKTLVSTAADRTMKLFDAATLNELHDFPPQSDWVLAVAFSPDGKRLAAGRFDGTLDILNLPATPVHAASVGQAVSPATVAQRGFAASCWSAETPWMEPDTAAPRAARPPGWAGIGSVGFLGPRKSWTRASGADPGVRPTVAQRFQDYAASAARSSLTCASYL